MLQAPDAFLSLSHPRGPVQNLFSRYAFVPTSLFISFPLKLEQAPTRPKRGRAGRAKLIQMLREIGCS